MANNTLLIAGVAGRMGRAIASEAVATPGVILAGGFDRDGSDHIGTDIGVLAGLDAIGLPVTKAGHTAFDKSDVVIDFTIPDATVANAQKASEAGIAHIIGTTGFSAAQDEAIAAAAQKTAIVKSGNMSLGVNVLCALVERASSILDENFDIEISDVHHRAKVDAPSGTALMLGDAAARGRGVDLNDKITGADTGRAGVRRSGDIGFAVSRAGGVIGEHSVAFASMDEIVTLSHSAISRNLFARGAVRAAQWAIGKPPGLYSMRDVLGL